MSSDLSTFSSPVAGLPTPQSSMKYLYIFQIVIFGLAEVYYEISVVYFSILSVVSVPVVLMRLVIVSYTMTHLCLVIVEMRSGSTTPGSREMYHC